MGGRTLERSGMGRSARVAAALLSLALGVSLGCASLARGETLLFVGNSFTYGALSPVQTYHAGSVEDLNGDGVGGVPALVKTFADEAGLHYDVSLETSPGKDLQWHIDNRAARLDRAWDHVVLQSYSSLSAAAPGDPADLVRSAATLATMFHGRNPAVDIQLDATWSRADLTYRRPGPWYGKPISAMQADVRAGYDKAAAASPFIRAVIPVGGAWNRAIDTGFAAPNPYDPPVPGRVDLWAIDHYHASTFGYYLEALTIFGSVTGRDPRGLGPDEAAAKALGLTPEQAVALQKVAADELAAAASVRRGTRPEGGSGPR